MSRAKGGHYGPAVGFPRVSGDEPDTSAANGDDATFSPRERG